MEYEIWPHFPRKEKGQIILVFIPPKGSEINIRWFKPLTFETFRFVMEQIQLEDTCARAKMLGGKIAIANVGFFFSFFF